MANEITVAILGMGRLGTSVALALKRYNARKDAQHHFDVLAYDPRPAAREAAEEKKAATFVRDPHDAIKGRDIVFIDMPYADVKPTYQTISDGLRAGAVVLDASPLKNPSLDWAKQYLPESTYLVGVMPIYNPETLYDGVDDTEHASETLLDNGAMLLMPSVTCPPEAVELASDFSALLGAKPHFVDPAEHDGLVAATEGLPALLGVTLFRSLYRGGGWQDVQRFTNPDFGRITHHLFDTHPDDLRDELLNNRDNLVRQLDQYTETLHELRTVLATGDREALEVALIEAAEEYNDWLNRRVKDKWEANGKGDTNNMGGAMLDGLLGGFLSRKLRRGNNDED